MGSATEKGGNILDNLTFEKAYRPVIFFLLMEHFYRNRLPLFGQT